MAIRIPLLPARGNLLFGGLFVALVLSLAVGGWIGFRPKPAPERPFQGEVSRVASSHFKGKVQFDLLAKLLADDRRSSPPDEWLQELADPKADFRVQTPAHPLLGRVAPNFTLSDDRGETWSLRAHLDRGPVVLVFYLGYACNFCVHDLFELNADLERFQRLGAEVVAVSGDSAELTRQRYEQYGGFQYMVLSDAGHGVARSYGTYRPPASSKPEVRTHGTFIVGRDGLIHWAYCGDIPFGNNKALMYQLARLENKLQDPGTASKSRKESKRP